MITTRIHNKCRLEKSEKIKSIIIMGFDPFTNHTIDWQTSSLYAENKAKISHETEIDLLLLLLPTIYSYRMKLMI